MSFPIYIKRNKRIQSGFTILELLVVIAMITILLVIMFASFGKAKTKASDDVKINNLNIVILALEQYHTQCKVYPMTLDLTANNVYPTSGGVIAMSCSQFSEYLRSNIDLSMFQYASLRNANIPTGYCSAYHISMQLDNHELNNGKLAEDSDWAGSSSLTKCGNSGPSVVPNDDTQGYYDIKHP